LRIVEKYLSNLLALVAALACTQSTLPVTLVQVRVENPTFSLFLNSSRTLVANVRIANASGHEIMPVFCGNIQVEREDSPEVFTNVNIQLECLSLGLPGGSIRPHSEAVFQLRSAVLVNATPVGRAYRVKFGIVADGNGSPRTVTSDPFVVAREVAATRSSNRLLLTSSL
jgi:hypothetical protein